MAERELDTNKKTWNAVAGQFFAGTALPEWGVFAVGKDNESLIGQIEGKIFVEIGCGSGHSIDYLIQRGAAKVYALDLSHTQIEFAQETNKQAIAEGKVMLFEQPMEEPLSIEGEVDTVFSIYALGWTLDHNQVLQNANRYLKPGGRFIWSWEHPGYPKVEYKDGQYVVVRSYHDESVKHAKRWGTDEGVYMAVRKISTWYNSLRQNGFEVTQIIEPTPLEFQEKHQDPERYYSEQRANLVPATIIFDCRKVQMQ